MNPYREPEKITVAVSSLPIMWRMKRVLAYTIIMTLAESAFGGVIYLTSPPGTKFSFTVAVDCMIHVILACAWAIIAVVRWCIRTLSEDLPE